jgi:hypothetical protein
MGLSPGVMDTAAILGAVLHLVLISIIAYRMGYRWRWLPVPWIATFLLSAGHQAVVYHEAARVGLPVNAVDFFCTSIARSSAFGLLVALVALALGGPRKATLQSTELANA